MAFAICAWALETAADAMAFIFFTRLRTRRWVEMAAKTAQGQAAATCRSPREASTPTSEVFPLRIHRGFAAERWLTVRLAPAYDGAVGELVMSKLNDANKRLDLALAQLEGALSQREAQAGDAAGAGEESARLQGELTQLHAAFATLQETSGSVSVRLDSAIDRLRTVLAQ